MNRLALALLVALLTPFLPQQVLAIQIVLQATQDNTMYGEAPSNSNGLGDYLGAGKTGSASGIRRGLISFDVSTLPADIRVDRVALELTLQGITNMEGTPRDLSVHRLLADWGEGSSNAGPGGMTGAGNGAAATPGDATWRYRFFDSAPWSSYDSAIAGSGGGDFVAPTSAAATVGLDPGAIIVWETTRGGSPSGLMADVEHWLTTPADNHGWLLKAVDEGPLRTFRRFYSKDETTVAFRPRLVVDFTNVPEPASAIVAVVGLMGLAAVHRRRAT